MDYPRIEITLTSMKQRIVHALLDYHADIAKYVEGELARQIAAFDYERAVRVAADAAIEEVVGKAVKGLIGWELQTDINQMVRERIAARLNQQEER